MRMPWEDNIDYKNTATATVSDYVCKPQNVIIAELLNRVAVLEKRVEILERRTDE